MEWKILESEIGKIRKTLSDIAGRIKAMDKTLLPDYNEEFEDAQRLIENELFDIVVCGEVKKGKSSFINAIIGEDILPTNTEVATSQVFRIINKEEKRFFLVFTNGERLEIGNEQLSRYGSQVDADAEGDPMFANHALDYIEVWYPMEFLPKQIAIVDTPGIGALYAAHERITTQYLKKASAVVFILDPQNPITDPEVKFVEKALSVTKHMTFVMTKYDNYDENYVIGMIRRDEEILNEKFKRDFKILPMSSKMLAEAAKEDIDILREDSLEQSLFVPVRDSLLSLVYKSMGFSRNVYVFNVFNSYNTAVMKFITNQMAVLSQPSSSKDLIEQKEKLKKEFIDNWGAKGKKQAEITVQLNDIIISLRNRVSHLFSTAGPIYTKFCNEIDGVGLMEMEEYGKNLPRRIQDEFGQAWKEILDDCHENVQRILREFNYNMTKADGGDADFSGSIPDYHSPSLDMMQYFNHFRNGFMSVAFTVMLASMAAIPVAGWVVTGLIAIMTGASVKKEKEMRGRAAMKTFVHDALVALQQDLCIKPTSVETPISMLQKVERDLKENAQQSLSNIFERQKANVDKQLALLNEQIKKEGDDRKEALKKVTDVREMWMPIHKSLVETKAGLDKLNKLFNELNV